MNVLMFSMDRTLLGEKNSQGDTVERHQEYGRFVNQLFIIVKSGPGFVHQQFSSNVEAYPTNSKGYFGLYRALYGFTESIISHQGIDLIVTQAELAPFAAR